VVKKAAKLAGNDPPGLVRVVCRQGVRAVTDIQLSAKRLTSILILFLLVLVLIPLIPSRVADSQTAYLILKADFHAHSTYSDGWYTPTKVVDIYAYYGYDIMTVSDHNYNRGWAEATAEGAKKGVLVVQAEELSYNFEDGSYKHIVGLFLTKHIYNRTWVKNDLVKPIFDAIHAQGGIGIAVHPQCPYPKSSVASWDRIIATNPTYIDAFEYSFQQNVTTVPAYNVWLVNSSYTMLATHDYHYKNTTMATQYTIVLAQNRTLAGVKEALLAKRTLVYDRGTIIGDQWVLDAYNYSLNLTHPSLPP
jgi:hypothetical protein